MFIFYGKLLCLEVCFKKLWLRHSRAEAIYIYYHIRYLLTKIGQLLGWFWMEIADNKNP